MDSKKNCDLVNIEHEMTALFQIGMKIIGLVFKLHVLLFVCWKLVMDFVYKIVILFFWSITSIDCLHFLEYTNKENKKKNERNILCFTVFCQ